MNASLGTVSQAAPQRPSGPSQGIFPIFVFILTVVAPYKFQGIHWAISQVEWDLLLLVEPPGREVAGGLD